jgi:Nif-specific regulatory protein
VSPPLLSDLHALIADRRVDLDEVLTRIVDRVAQDLRADRCTLYVVDRAAGQLVSRAAHLPEIAEIRLTMGEGVAGRVAVDGEVIRLEPGPASRATDRLTGYATRSLLAAPVTDTAGRVVAVVEVLNRSEGAFDDRDEQRLRELCDEVSGLLFASSLGSQLRPGQRHSLSYRYNHIVGDSPLMRLAFERTARAARTGVTVLVRGESGAGKELFARAVHDNSDRRDGPFVKVDCAALPETLIENELFGHRRGAYTSADARREGLVDAAAGGTLLLDEVGELSPAVQGKLLRLVQDRQFLRVGGDRVVDADVRFVFATHRDLEADIVRGRFREDLYWRVRVVEIHVPPLRQRGHADLDRLIDHFVGDTSERHGRTGLVLSDRARAALHGHGWPGNVRELLHAVEAAVVLCPGERIRPEHLPSGIGEPDSSPMHGDPELFHTRPRRLREVEADYIVHVLALNQGNRTATARQLGISRSTLLRKLARREDDADDA